MSNISCILYPPTLDYHYLVQRPQQLMKNFSELNVPAYYLNNPSPHNNVGPGVEKLNENFFLFNQVDPAPYLKNLQPVVYYTSAAQADLIQQYNPALVVFDSVDEPSEEFESWRPFYDKAVRSADIVLTTSDKLFELASSINPRCYLIPNGCDYEHFSNRIHGRPAEIANLTGPIIGYIGVVATWVDVELIARVADSNPDCNVVVVGPLYNVSDVPQRPNIHWLGFKNYEQLPAFAQSFDIGLVPFRVSSMTDAVNPIKMWEYMATGMPIVTTDMPEARKYGDLVYVSANVDEFIINVGRAIAEYAPEMRERRIQLAQENSWKVRATHIIQLIEECLAVKGISRVGLPEVVDIGTPLPYHVPTQIVTSEAHSYKVSFKPSSRAFTNRNIKIGRKVAFRITNAPIERRSISSRDSRCSTRTSRYYQGNIKVLRCRTYKYYTARCVR